METTRNLYFSCCRESGREEKVDMVVLPETCEAIGRGDGETLSGFSDRTQRGPGSSCYDAVGK